MRERSAHIISAFRSIVSPRGGDLARFKPYELAAPIVKKLIHHAGLEADQVDEIIVSNALGAGGNPARLVALASGLPELVAGLSIDRQCCGGLDALGLAQAMIQSGHAEAIIAGGVESYSQRPVRLRSDHGATPTIVYDQPPFTPEADQDPNMAEAADRTSDRLNISRFEQDEWAVRSHRLAMDARQALKSEIVPISVGIKEYDTYSRNLTPKVCRRAPVIFGNITHGNSAVAADASAFCLIVSDALARDLKKPSLRILKSVTQGADPAYPALAPVFAIKNALKQTEISIDQIDQVELMEAYAAQALACISCCGLDPARTNIKGGALARGHPIGASGTILAVRLFHDLIEQKGKLGLASIAAAGGLGSAVILQA